jgi:hypothetical protein
MVFNPRLRFGFRASCHRSYRTNGLLGDPGDLPFPSRWRVCEECQELLDFWRRLFEAFRPSSHDRGRFQNVGQFGTQNGCNHRNSARGCRRNGSSCGPPRPDHHPAGERLPGACCDEVAHRGSGQEGCIAERGRHPTLMRPSIFVLSLEAGAVASVRSSAALCHGHDVRRRSQTSASIRMSSRLSGRAYRARAAGLSVNFG